MGDTYDVDFNATSNFKKVSDDINSLKSNVESLGKAFGGVVTQVDEVIKHIENLTAVTSAASKNVGNTINNANTYNTTKKTTKVGGSKYKNSVVVGDTVYEYNVGSRDAASKEAKQKGLSALQAELELKQKLVLVEQEHIEKIKKETELLSARALNYKQDSDSKAKNAEANLTNAKLKEKYPYLFGNGAQYRNPKIQTGRALTAIGNVAISSGVPGGKIVGELFNSVGAFARGLPAGIATTVANLAKATADFGKEAVQAYAEINSIKTQLGVVFSSQTQADSMFGEISQYAVKSPFGVQQTSELAVLLKQSGVYASDLMDTLKMLGDTAGGNMEKMKRIANNYAQIMAIGKASMLDMRQFAYAGIPIFEAVSKELGVSQQELRKLISDGKVTADIVEKVFKDLTGVNGIFENATEKGAKTLKARLQNLADAKQLALSSVGEVIAKSASDYGNDSLVERFVTISENFYSWMQQHADVKNIERDVNLISTNNARIKALEDMLEYAKESGDKDLEKLIKAEILAQKNVFDYEKQRSIYAQSYDIKTGNYNRYKEQFGELTSAEINSRLVSARASKYALTNRLQQANDSELYANVNPLTEQERASINAQLDIYNQLIDDLKDYKQALEDVSKLTEEDVNADKERRLTQAQNLSYDQTNKYADSTSSLMTSFQELTEIYRDTDTYKEKQEEERQKRLKEALDILQVIAKNTDESGKVDITKFSSAELLTYIQKGAFKSTERLDVVPKNGVYNEENRALLESQFGYVESLTEDFLKSLGSGYTKELNEIEKNSIKSISNLDNENFYKSFKDIREANFNTIDEAIAKSDTATASILEGFKKLLDFALNKQETDTGGSTLTETDLEKAAKQQFIPLWKRILSAATGLSTSGMTDVKSTMQNYTNDMAIRNMASSVLSATLKSTDLNTAQSLIKTNGSAKVLRGTTQGVYQVDWLETKKAMHDFATQLSASTDVITAYKKGLEDELEVYQQLIVAGYTQGESQDLKNQKTISTKQYEKLSKDLGEQLVNAYGRKLVTAGGQEVTYKDGKYYDEKGYEVQVEQLKMTDDLYDMVSTRLEKLYGELHEANLKEANNTAIEKMFKTLSSTMFTSTMIKENGVNAATTYIASNPEYMESLLNSGIKMFQSETKYDKNTKKRVAKWDKLEGLSTPDILFAANNYNGEQDVDSKEAQASAIVSKVFDTIIKNLNELLNSPEYKELEAGLRTQDRDNAVNAELIALKSLYDNLKAGNQAFTSEGNIISSATALKPEDYTGARGVRNRMLKYGFGIDQGYDIEDLYIQAAKTAKLEGQGKNQFGIDIDSKNENGEYRFKNEDGTLKSDEDILKNLNDQEKAWIRIAKAQEDSAKILADYGNEMTGILADIGKSALEKPFEKMGENLVLGKEASEGMEDVYKNLAAELLSASGAAMTKAGWELVARGAADKNYAMIGAGLALAGAGAFAAGLGSGLTQEDKETKEAEDKAKKLEDLKNNLADLLKQAREDAIYYENTLRHKKAISANDEFTSRSVHDAIITPQGQVVTTDPKDYLIATKTPKSLIGSGAPTINFSVIDRSTGIKVTQQKSTYNQETNSIDFEAIIESKVTEMIASEKGDEAFAARQARLNGRTVIA